MRLFPFHMALFMACKLGAPSSDHHWSKSWDNPSSESVGPLLDGGESPQPLEIGLKYPNPKGKDHFPVQLISVARLQLVLGRVFQFDEFFLFFQANLPRSRIFASSFRSLNILPVLHGCNRSHYPHQDFMALQTTPIKTNPGRIKDLRGY